jgi:hypothetical protein
MLRASGTVSAGSPSGCFPHHHHSATRPAKAAAATLLVACPLSLAARSAAIASLLMRLSVWCIAYHQPDKLNFGYPYLKSEFAELDRF